MFIPYRTTPTEDVLGELSDLGCEVAVHADEVLPGKLSTQREMMEKIAGREVSGVAYHGRDLSDVLIHKLTGKTRYISYHNPFRLVSSTMQQALRQATQSFWSLEVGEFCSFKLFGI
jgi:hypothetical protein